jgi:hypothetical protein
MPSDEKALWEETMKQLAAVFRPTLILALAMFAFGSVDRALAAQDPPQPKKLQKITPADRKAAARRAAKMGVKPGVSGQQTGVQPAAGHHTTKPGAARSGGRTP